MTRTESEIMEALSLHARKRALNCAECAYKSDEYCSEDLAADARDLLISQHRSGENDTVIQLVKEALDAGGQYITISADGNVSMWPDTVTARLVPGPDRGQYHCSGCGTVFGAAAMTYRFCPECGAEFEEDDDETERRGRAGANIQTMG